MISRPQGKRPMFVKVYHLASRVCEDGRVSALCFNRSGPPRAINLNHALWTTDIKAVTCPRCRGAFLNAKRFAKRFTPQEDPQDPQRTADPAE